MKAMPLPAAPARQSSYKVQSTKNGNSFGVDLENAAEKIQTKNAIKKQSENSSEESSNISSQNTNTSEVNSDTQNKNIGKATDDAQDSGENINGNDNSILASNGGTAKYTKLISELIADPKSNTGSLTDDRMTKEIKAFAEEINQLLTKEQKADSKNLKSGINSEAVNSNSKNSAFEIVKGIVSELVAKNSMIKVNGSSDDSKTTITNDDNQKLSILGGFENAKISIESNKLKTEGESANTQGNAVNIDILNNSVSTGDGFQGDKNTKDEFINKFFDKNLKNAIAGDAGGKPAAIKQDTATGTLGANIDRLIENVKLREIPKLTSNLVKNLSENGSGTARLYLQPKSLGTVFVELQLTGDLLNVKFKTENSSVKQIIENQMFLLKDKLQNQGLKIENFDVRNFTQDAAENQNFNQNAFEKEYSRQEHGNKVKNTGSQIIEPEKMQINDESSSPKQQLVSNGRIETYI